MTGKFVIDVCSIPYHIPSWCERYADYFFGFFFRKYLSSDLYRVYPARFGLSM